jgi:hypothetical protein
MISLSANALRALQVGALALAVAGNLSLSTVAFLVNDVTRWYALFLPLSLLALVAIAFFFLLVQRAAHELGGPKPVSPMASTIALCCVVSFIAVPMLIARTGKQVAIALDDDGIRLRSLIVAWAVALAPIFVSGPVRALCSGLGIHYMVSVVVVPLVGILLSGIATQVVAGPVIDVLASRVPLDAVDANGTPAAIRSL